MSHLYDSPLGPVYGVPTVNIAQGNAVVGAQIGGIPGGAVECFAWVRDEDGVLWVLHARTSDGGVYSDGTTDGDFATTIDGLKLDGPWHQLGPKVWIS